MKKTFLLLIVMATVTLSGCDLLEKFGLGPNSGSSAEDATMEDAAAEPATQDDSAMMEDETTEPSTQQ